MNNVAMNKTEENIYMYRKLNKLSAAETARIFNISRTRIDNICSKWDAIERRRQDPLFVYLEGNSRIYNALQRAGIHSIEKLCGLTRAELLQIEHIGVGALQFIIKKQDESL